MNLLGFLTGGSKAASKVIDASINGLDKLYETTEEKNDFRMKIQEIHLRMVEVTANESTASSISRRMICLPVVYVWLILVLAKLLGVVWLDLTAEQLEAIQDEIVSVGPAALVAIGFYCGRHIANSWNNKK